MPSRHKNPNYQRDWARKKRAEDPEFVEKSKEASKRWYYENLEDARKYFRDRMREKMADPAFREEKNRKEREKRASDPEYRERVNAKARERTTTDEFRAKRRARYASDAEFREAWNARRRGTLRTRTRKHLPVLIARQGGLCGLCGEPLGEITPKIHVDHVVPRSFGGNDELDNLQAAHRRCNIAKGNRRMF